MSVGWREGFPPLSSPGNDNDGDQGSHPDPEGHDGWLFADEDDTDQTDRDQLHIVHGRATLMADPTHRQTLHQTPATGTTTDCYQAARAALGLTIGPRHQDSVEDAHARLAWACETFGDRDAVMKLQPRLSVRSAWRDSWPVDHGSPAAPGTTRVTHPTPDELLLKIPRLLTEVTIPTRLPDTLLASIAGRPLTEIVDLSDHGHADLSRALAGLVVAQAHDREDNTVLTLRPAPLIRYGTTRPAHANQI